MTETPNDQVLLATGGYDHTIRFWTAHNGHCQRVVQHPDSHVNALEFSPDRALLAAGGFQHIRMYDIPGSNNPNPIATYEGVSKNITSLGFQVEGKWIYSGGEDCSVRIWDLRSRGQQSQRMFTTTSPVNTVYLHRNQTEIYIGTQSGAIHVWDIRKDQSEQFMLNEKKEVSVQHLHIDTDGHQLAAIDNQGACYFMDVKGTGTELFNKRFKLRSHSRYGLKCRYSPDSTLLVTTSADQTAKVWRTANLVPIADGEEESGWPVSDSTLAPLIVLADPNQRWVWDVAFTNDSQYIITGSSDNLARLWDVNTGEIKREFSGHQKAIIALAFSDGVV
ncbi:Target of rapamycin complex subunit lst8 [Halotydeus destructor]|nr:Target of rapamycin complex subunit lst8 [Halotydeus destructor]